MTIGERRKERDLESTPMSDVVEYPSERSSGRATGQSGLDALRRLACSALLASAVGAAAPNPLTGQEMHVRLLARPDGSAVSGAYVQLRSDGGEAVDEDLSGPSGDVELEADGAGTYRLRVQRIGYRTWTSPPLRLEEAGSPLRRTFRIPLSPVRREDLDVPLEQRCRMPEEQGRKMARLWDQIESALALTAISRPSERPIYTVKSFRRPLDRSGELLHRDTAAVDVRRTFRPFDPPSADCLARFGFMVEKDPGRYRYFAPAPEVLRSREFFDTHCLGFRSGEEVGRSSWIGVSFKPAPGRELPDVRGTFWLDRDRAWLRRLVFSCVNLGFPDTPELTGRVDLARLPGPGRFLGAIRSYCR